MEYGRHVWGVVNVIDCSSSKSVRQLSHRRKESTG